MIQQWKAHLAMLIVALIYGINYFVTKSVVPEYIKPFGAILIRVAFGSALFILVHVLFVREKVERKDYLKLALCAFFGVALNQLMFFKGLSITRAVNASLIMTTTPILVLIVSAIFLKEAITWKKILGIILGATGAVLLIAGSDFSFGSETIWGDLFILINASSYGIYLVLVKPLMNKYKALTVVRWTFSFGFLMILPFGFSEAMELKLAVFTPKVLWAMGFIILFTTFMAYLLNAWSLRFVNASVVGFYIYLQPVITTILTLVLGLEIDLVRTLLLSSLIFTGVYLVSK